MNVLDALAGRAIACPDETALVHDHGRLDWRTLHEGVQQLRQRLARYRPRTLALLADNGPFWVMADLACLAEGVPCLPLPPFFHERQIRHVLADSGADLLWTDRADPVQVPRSIRPDEGSADRVCGLSFRSFPLVSGAGPAPVLEGTARISYTSGSTGTPRGVRLTRKAMADVAASLCHVTRARPDDRHLSVLPYAILLENIAGIHAPILAGATLLCPGPERTGLRGATAFDPQRLLETIEALRPTTLVLMPELLRALVAHLRTAPGRRPEGLRLVAVGGAQVSPRLLDEAEALGLPVRQGYGLTECCSVVTLEPPGPRRAGSVGLPLPHVDVRIAPDGEILVRGALFQGYLGEPERDPEAREYWPTGDIGHLDEAGHLHVTGRRRDLFITAHGRNVSPEWVERELLAEPAIAQACAIGEARPRVLAIVVPAAEATPADVDRAVAAANARLPDYARIGRWIPARTPFTRENGLLGPSGLPQRGRIERIHASAIDPRDQEAS